MDARASGIRGRAALFAGIALAFAVASCGGEERDREVRPTIPRDVAEQLAARSVDVAEALERGDPCAAAELADSLQASAGKAIERGRIPEPLGDELELAVARLSGEIECPPASREEPPAEEDAESEEDERGQDGGDGQDGDEVTTTTSTQPATTTTEEDTTTTTEEDTTTTLEETTTLDEG